MDQLLSRLQRALAGRYVVEHELGRGGMAVVFLGRDERLSRRVAIKVFEQDENAALGADRFLREVRVAAQLQHPNILPVFDSGEAPGLLYYVMPYVTGPSLRERLEREGPLPVSDAVRIAREVAEALDHAHRAGIVHRDVKPDNIMLADGVAVVADFGIAHAVESSKLTETGMALGTPMYMSPEQATAAATIDGRADIYALGCVLYEMLTGNPPFSGKTSQAVMARHAIDTVPPIQTVRTVPVALEDAISKSLAKLPGDRWPTGKSFADALAVAAPGTATMPVVTSRSRVPMFAAVAIIAALAFVAWNRWPGARSASAAESPAQSVAVLPVAVLGDTGLAKYADGFREAAINGLVRIRELTVKGADRASVESASETDPRAIGRGLGAEAVVASTLQEAGGRLRLGFQLINVRDGRVRGATKYFEGTTDEIFSMQDSVIAGLVDALGLRLSDSKRSSLVRGQRTSSPEAYRLFAEAERQLNRVSTVAVLDSAIDKLQRALTIDSKYADALVALSVAERERDLRFLGKSPAEVALSHRRLLDRAIELDSTNPAAFAERGKVRLMEDWDWEAAQRDIRHAIDLAPGSDEGVAAYEEFLMSNNQFDSAIYYIKRGLKKDPTNPIDHLFLANVYYNGRYRDSALAAGDRAIQLDSTIPFAYWAKMNASFDAGRRADADSAAARMVHFANGDPGAYSLAAAYYRRSGNAAAARRLYDRVMAMSKKRQVDLLVIAQVRLAVGDRGGALAALEEAARKHEASLPATLLWSLTDLRGDPRFEAVRRQVFGNRPLPPDPFK